MRGALAGRRVLGLFPHPDDETYSAAGLLAWCAAEGAAVHLGAATRGERGWDRYGLLQGAALAARRSAELDASCAALGAAPPVCFDLPDGGLPAIDHAAAAAALTTHLRVVRPHLVVTLGADGAYGHRDHLAWTAIVDAAVRGVAADLTPRLLHAVFPRGLFGTVCRIGQRTGVVDPALDGNALGVTRDAADLRLDVRALRAAKLAACRAHDTQLDVADGTLFRRILEPLLEEEWFAVAHGPPLPRGAADPFAGL